MSVLDAAVAESGPSHVFGLFSGGHDSLCSTALAARHPRFSGAVHINTGIGIEETREFVRDTCKRQGWPLIEMHPDGKTYEELVLEKGFPGGSKAHSTHYYWLKQRQIRRLVREHKTSPGDRIGLVTGIRLSESVRRLGAGISVPVRRQGAQLWVNPILDWTASDCNKFIEAEGLARNQVCDLLHRSGECLCGALAQRGEIREIERWYPDTAARIHSLEARVTAIGHLEDVWAGRLRVSRQQMRLPLCVSCEGALL